MQRDTRNIRWARAAGSVRPIMGAITALGGVVILIGCAAEIEILTSLLPGVIHTLPNTAVTFVAAGIALLAGVERPTKTLRSLFWLGTGVTLLIGGITFFERMTNIDAGIDRWLFVERLQDFPYRPTGRFASNSALSFVLAGTALLLYGVRKEKRSIAGEALGFATLAIATLALTGYLYGARPLYSFDRAAGMGFFTAVLFFTLGVGLVFMRPTAGLAGRLGGDDLGALLARRLLPVMVLVPLVIGAVHIRLREASLVSREGGMALVVLLIMTTLVGFLLWTASVVGKLDLDREALLAREAEARRNAEVAMEEANRANRAKSEFLAVMSHELRTPLNAISGYIELIQLGIRGPVTDAQRQDLERVNRAQRHLLSLINDLLNLARVEGGRLQYEIARVEIPEVLEDLRELVAPQASSKKLECTIERGASVAATADREKVEQILLNLLTNAIKFTPEGGRITMRASAIDDRAIIAVSDTGRGIPKSRQTEIFEPFVQVQRITAASGDGGIGLGLSISRQLALGMNGTLEVESEEGKGSTFVLTLPAADEDTQAHRKSAAFSPQSATA
jgi:signal transduction histidine kinase